MTHSAISNLEQRKEPRYYGNFPVFVRAVTATGKRLKISTEAYNISRGGVFIKLSFPLDNGTQLFAFINWPNSESIAATGRVVRTEDNQNGDTGVAVCFEHTHILQMAA